MKPARILTITPGSPTAMRGDRIYVLRAGASGTGRTLARVTGWNTVESRLAAYDILTAKAEVLGFEAAPLGEE